MKERSAHNYHLILWSCTSYGWHWRQIISFHSAYLSPHPLFIAEGPSYRTKIAYAICYARMLIYNTLLRSLRKLDHFHLINCFKLCNERMNPAAKTSHPNSAHKARLLNRLHSSEVKQRCSSKEKSAALRITSKTTTTSNVIRVHWPFRTTLSHVWRANPAESILPPFPHLTECTEAQNDGITIAHVDNVIRTIYYSISGIRIFFEETEHRPETTCIEIARTVAPGL